MNFKSPSTSVQEKKITLHLNSWRLTLGAVRLGYTPSEQSAVPASLRINAPKRQSAEVDNRDAEQFPKTIALTFLINKPAQKRIAELIDRAVEQVLGEIASHGNEEGMTTALGHALMRRQIQEPDLKVDFKYRQHNKYTEEKHSGADGGFLVRIVTPSGSVEKAALFQAKLIGGIGDVRTLKISKAEALRLRDQSKDMLRHTEDAVAIFYTMKNIYVVDAEDYGSNPASNKPLSQEHRLITLGTYLGKWMPRCTKGDEDPDFVKRARHLDGFKHGLAMNVVSQRPSVPWEPDRAENAWKHKG